MPTEKFSKETDPNQSYRGYDTPNKKLRVGSLRVAFGVIGGNDFRYGTRRYLEPTIRWLVEEEAEWQCQRYNGKTWEHHETEHDD